MMATHDISLAAAQEQVIRQMLDKWKAQGKVKSDAEYDLLLKQYIDQIAAQAPIMNITPVSDVVDADRITETFEGFEVDIMSAYTAINAIGETINKHKMLNQSVLNTVELDIKHMDDKLDEYEARLGVNGAQGLYIQRFRDNNSVAKWDNSFTDRTDALLAPAYQCSLDVEMEALQLPLVSWSNQLIGPSGVHLASIKVGMQLGSGFISLRNPEHAIEKSIDESMETFWSESILSDAPFQVDYIDSDAALHIRNGAVCDLEIDFDYMSQISQISLTPFTEYPMRLEAILYYNEELNQWEDLVGPTKILKGQYFTGTVSYEFPEVATKKLKIILNQIHYVKEDYIVSSKEERNRALWMKATAESDVPEPYNNKALYQNKAEEYPAWASFMNKIKKQHMDLETFAENFNTDVNHTLSKYQYDYGLYNISVYRNEYQDRGIYVSKALPTTGVTRAVRMGTKEYHPVIEGSGVITDIEYSVTDGQSWYPIMPDNRGMIPAELLIPYAVSAGRTLCKTRFAIAAGSLNSVSRNGQALQQGEYSISGGVVSVSGYDKSAVYTITYVPSEDSKTVDFLAKIPRVNGKLDLTKMQRSVETYGGTDENGFVMLRYIPFVDKERLAALASDPTWDPTYVQSAYFPINIHVVDSGGQHIDHLLSNNDARPIYLTNMTNYFDPEQKNNLQAFDPAKLNYQYQVSGNQVQFNAPLPGNTKIMIEYPYLVSEVKVKALMRRNSHLFQGITPILHEYIVSFETLS